MNYKDTAKRLLDRGLIKKQGVNFNQIDALLFRAKKDLIASKANLEIDEEVTYNYAYLAMLRCGRAIMFMEGYRPTTQNCCRIHGENPWREIHKYC